MTQAEVDAYNARQRSGLVPLKVENACTDESKLHRQIWDYCASKGWLVFHGSMAHRAHRTLGEPDLIICQNDGKVLFVECKAKGGKLSLDQQSVIAWLEKLNQRWAVVYNFEQFLNLVNPKET